MFETLRFSPSLGRRGEQLTSCEEVDLLRRCIDSGGVGQWVKGASLAHRIPPERVSMKYLARFYSDYGRSEQSLKSERGLFELLRFCIRYRLSIYCGWLIARRTNLRSFVKWHYYKGRLLQAVKPISDS